LGWYQRWSWTSIWRAMAQLEWRNWSNKDLIKLKAIWCGMWISAWNPSVLPDTTKSFDENVSNNKAALPPCHAFFFNFMFWW
jgi:hypothetical protein